MSSDIVMYPMSKPPKLRVEESINDRMKNKPKDLLHLRPRKYQSELYESALRENVIIYLGTGLGKTFVIVLFLNSPFIDEQITLKRKVAFLATTQDLVKQQAEYVNKQVTYRVKLYTGRSGKCGQHIDHWSESAWQDELQKIDIMFMTPQIFTAAISTGHLKWYNFSAVIFDEVHHASRNAKKRESKYAYVVVLKHYRFFYESKPQFPKPRLIGLTASLINSMPKDRDDIRDGVRYLENLLSAKCITDLNVIDKRPETVLVRYAHFDLSLGDILTTIFTTFAATLNSALEVQKALKLISMKSYDLTQEETKVLAFHNRLRLAAAGFSIKPGSFPKVFEGMNKIRKSCGLWMLRFIASKLIDALSHHSKNTCLPFEMKSIYLDFREAILSIHNVLDVLLKTLGTDDLFKYTRRKPKALLDILKKEYKRVRDGSSKKSDFSCIIFVQSRLEVVALTKWIQTVSSSCLEYSFIKSDYAIGLAATMSSKYSCITKRKPVEQYKMLDDFRNNLLNTIITTSVLEEGIDLPVCSTVIHYDVPNNFRQHVQSRGRARQEIASNIFICKSDKFSEQVDMLSKFDDFEKTIKSVLNEKSVRNSSLSSSERVVVPPEDLDDFFWESDNSLYITATTAKTILSMYCNNLSKDSPYTDGIRYDRLTPVVNDLQMFQTILYLPMNCRLADKGIKGQLKTTPQLADNSAIIATVKYLYKEKELNQYAAPTRRTEENVDELLASVNLEPNFDTLDPSLEGISVPTEEGKEIFLFKPYLIERQEFLSKNYENRLYKLLRIAFTSDSSTTREDTRKYFEKSVFGLIVDSALDTEFIPSQISSHYGLYKIQFKVVQENFSIRNLRHHIDYLNYTHRFLTRCLNIFGINREDFKERCMFYIVPLDESDMPDLMKMNSAFHGRLGLLEPNDIVKHNSAYLGVSSRTTADTNRFMLVRAIRSDMSIHSYIPGRRQTFIEDAEQRLGRRINERDQRIVEVAPLSKDFGSVLQVKKSDRGYTTNSWFFLEQFLVSFDKDPYSIFQAYLMPEIIYRLYLVTMASKIDSIFQNETEGKRNTNIKKSKTSSKAVDLDLQDLEQEDLNLKETEQEDSEAPMNLEDSDLENSNEEFSDSEMDFDSEGTNYDEEDLIVGPDYKEMITKRTLELNHDDDSTEDLKRWDMSEYKVNDLDTTQFIIEDSSASDEAYLDQTLFTTLDSDVSYITTKLVAQIAQFQKLITADSTFLDENLEFEKRISKVDRSIVPPIHFDKPLKSLKEGSRVRSLLEALTLKRAQGLYNLEGLENVGDSYLKYVVSVVLFSRLEGNEGFLTSARSRLTSNKYFAHLAKKRNLGSFAITTSFSKDLLAFILGRKLDEEREKQFYNKMRSKNLADTFEAIIGSYLVYHNEYEATLSISWLGLDIFSENTFLEQNEKSIAFNKLPTALIDNISSESTELFKQLKRKFSRFQEIIGYTFQDISYLVQAFTHASCVTKITRSYERLEFLGDAILDFLVTKTLLHSIPMHDPGQITSSRSALVNNYQFARLAMKYKFDLFIQHFSHQLYDELTKVRLAIEEDPDMLFFEMVDYDRVAKLLGDVFESVAGAIYLDSGCSLDIVWSAYYPMMKESFDKEIEEPTKNLLANLYETFPGPDRITFEDFEILNPEETIIGVRIRVVGYDNVKTYRDFEGQGLNKHQAKLRAVAEAMKNPPSRAESERLKKEYNELYKQKYGQHRNRGGSRGGRRGGSRGGSRIAFRTHSRDPVPRQQYCKRRS